MDKIYTRKRIRLPSIRFVGFPNGRKGLKKKITYEIIVILSIAVMTSVFVIQSISPIIDKVCEDVAKSKATIVSNDVATKVMKNYTYDDLINIYKDSQGNITMLQSNIVAINEITSDVAIKIQEELINNEENEASIRLR